MRVYWPLLAALAGGELTLAQTQELSLVTEPALPGAVAIDFRQTLNPSTPDDAWLAGQLYDATTFHGATFRLISDVHGIDPNGPPDFYVPNRDGNGVTPRERMTSFMNFPTADRNAAGRFGPAGKPPAIFGTPVITATFIDNPFAGQFPPVEIGAEGFWARIAITLPFALPAFGVYVGNELRNPNDLLLAQGVMDWGTYSSQQDGDSDPSVETPWVIAWSPVPEPVTWLIGPLALGVIRGRRRR